MPAVVSFRGKNGFLSNFAYSPIVYDGETYPTVEHAFQAAKTFDKEQVEFLHLQVTAQIVTLKA